MTPLLVQFLSEARDLIEESVKGLLALEENPGDGASMNRLFRSVHTLKGSSGLFEEYAALTRVLHAGEDLLDSVRAGKLELNGEMVDQLLSAMDRIGAWLSAIEQEEKLPDWAEPEGKALAEKLRAWMAGLAGPKKEKASVSPLARDVAWLAELPESMAMAAYVAAVSANHPLLAIRYAPDAQCFFQGDDPLLQALRVPDLIAVHGVINDPWPESGLFDPFLCNLRFLVLCLAPRAVIDEMFLYLPDQVAIVEISPKALIRPRGPLGNPAQFTGMAEEFAALLSRKAWPEMLALARRQLEVGEPDSWQASLLRWIGVMTALATPDAGLLGTLFPLFDHSTPPGLAEGRGAASRESPVSPKGSTVEKAMLLAILKAQLALVDHPCPVESRPGRVASILAVLSGCYARLGRERQLEALETVFRETSESSNFHSLRLLLQPLIQEAEGQVAAEESVAVRPAAEAAAQSEKGRAVTLRVDQERIDRIMNLTGELVVAKNAIPFLAREAEEVHNVRGLAKKLKDQYGVINRIAEELQSAVMQVRMMPVSTIFQRFPRLVRDLSRKLDKRIDLVIVGETTEADKNVIEELSDPLIHLVRNSIDHGIESPDDREAANKPRSGTIHLAARQEGDEVIIEVRDDAYAAAEPALIARLLEVRDLLSAADLGEPIHTPSWPAPVASGELLAVTS
ncbi:MAG: Hpt domain-containing protein [Magnetococcales bacterium]|nr:Hpt domain-containing protein [Magnetococcales bacterium]